MKNFLKILFLSILLSQYSYLSAQLTTVNTIYRFNKGLQLKEQASPVTPDAGFGHLYGKTDNHIWWKDDAGVEYDLTLGAAFVGTVTSVSSGNFSPLFNVTVTNPTTTPAFSFAAISQAANLLFASPDLAAGTPTFRAQKPSDIASISGDVAGKRYFATYVGDVDNLEWRLPRKADVTDLDAFEVAYGAADGSGGIEQSDNLKYFPAISFLMLDGKQGIGQTSLAQARLHIKGFGSSTADTSLFVENSSGNDLFWIEDGGATVLQSIGGSRFIFNGNLSVTDAGGIIRTWSLTADRTTLNTTLVSGTGNLNSNSTDAAAKFFEVKMSSINSAGNIATKFFDVSADAVITHTGTADGNVIGFNYTPTFNSVVSPGNHYFLYATSGKIRTAMPANDDTNDRILTIDAVTNEFEYRTAASLGGGGGEANTASNLGGGLANFDSKSGVDLRFNSFAAADFNLASNLISIDYANGQAATAAQDGFLQAADFAIFDDVVQPNGQVVYGTGTSVTSEAAFKYTAASNKLSVGGFIGSGIANPLYSIHAESDGSQGEIVVATYGGNKSVFGAQFALGTQAVPTAVTVGLAMGEFGVSGYKATGWSASSTAAIRVYSADNFTDISTPTEMRLYTTPIGSVTMQQIMTLESDNQVRIGSGVAANDALDVTGTIDATVSYKLNGSTFSDAEFIVSAATAGLANEDVLTEGSAIDITNASGTSTVEVDINELSVDATPDRTADYVMTYDASAAGNKKVLLNNIASALMTGSNTSTVTASTTAYAPLGTAALNATETSRQWFIPFAATIKNLHVVTTTAQPASGNLVITVRKGAVSQTLTLTIAAAAAAGTFSDAVNSFDVVAGDLISVQLVNNATASSASVVGWSFEVLKK